MKQLKVDLLQILDFVLAILQEKYVLLIQTFFVHAYKYLIYLISN